MIIHIFREIFRVTAKYFYDQLVGLAHCKLDTMFAIVANMDLFIKIEIILFIFLLNLYHGNYNSRVFIETTDLGIEAITNDDHENKNIVS